MTGRATRAARTHRPAGDVSKWQAQRLQEECPSGQASATHTVHIPPVWRPSTQTPRGLQLHRRANAAPSHSIPNRSLTWLGLVWAGIYNPTHTPTHTPTHPHKDTHCSLTGLVQR